MPEVRAGWRKTGLDVGGPCLEAFGEYMEGQAAIAADRFPRSPSGFGMETSGMFTVVGFNY